jgi:hypothetical protein
MTGAGVALTELNGNVPFVQHEEPGEHAGVLFVQNDKRGGSDKESDDSAEKTDEETVTGVKSKREKSNGKSAKQIKPFVPSEKIPADQEVDFPYDI